MSTALQTTFLLYFVQILGHHCTYQFSTFDSHVTKVNQEYAEYLVECGPGEYINLCGECVSGHTEKDDDFGKDTCGICGGLETCRSQCSDPMDILDTDDDLKGCVKFISMAPNVLDLAESINGSISIFGDGISPETVANVDCAILKDGQTVVSIDGRVLEDRIDLTFPLPIMEGNYDLYCNTSLGIEFKQTVLIVNSKNLIPTSSNKPSLVTWVENKITLNVGNIAGPGDLLCFATTSSKELLFSEWTGLVSGNSFSSLVQCPSFVPIRPGDVEFGVAYSALGLKTAKTLKLMGLAVAPKPLTAVFKPDIGEIIVTFSQNLEEGDVNDCFSIFTSKTMSLLGNASECYATANKVHIKLRDTVMKNNTLLTFKDLSVKTKFSAAGGGGSVVVFTEDSRIPVSLEGKKRLCSGEQTRLAMSSDRQTVGSPTWKVVTKWSDISPGQRQRLNLLAWRAARASKVDPAAIDINSTSMWYCPDQQMYGSTSSPGHSSLLRHFSKDFKLSSHMTSGVRYTIKAIANDSTGTEREAVAEVVLSGPGETWLELEGPTSADIREYLFFRATLRSCGTFPQPIKYKWEMSSDNEKVDTFFANDSQLRLAPGTLWPGTTYRLSAEAFTGNISIASESIKVETYLQNFQIRLEDAMIIVGNGHSIEIDGSKATGVVSKAIKLKWVCKQGFCSLPGKDKTPLTSLDAFSQPFLRIPPKTMALGRYLIALEASLGDSIIGEEEVELVLVSGQPPRMSSLTTREDKDHFLLQLQVTEILQTCRLDWLVVPRLGYSYLDIEQKPVTVKGAPAQPKSVLMKLAINKNSLTPGSKIMLKASSDCDRVAQSYREFRFFVPEDLNGATLTVEPTDGRALETLFIFRLVERRGAGRVVYSFGYESSSGDVQVLYSGDNKEFRTYLGCCNVKTVARVCRTRFDCTSIYGPELRLSPPVSLNSSISKYFTNSYKEHLMNSNYEVALANLIMVIPAMKEADTETYNGFSKDIQKALAERIQVYAERLKSDKDCLEDSVRLLEAAGSVMASMFLLEDTVATVLKFRDLVHSSARSINEKMYEKKISAKLPSEPRQMDKNGNGMRHKRSTDLPQKISINAGEGALKAAILYLKQLGNDSEAAHRERSNLLDMIVYYSTKQCKAESPLRGVESRIKRRTSLNKNLDRHKRGVEDPIENTVKQVEAVLKPTILSIQQMANNSLNALVEKKKLIGFIMEYSTHMCHNLTTREIVGKVQDPVLLGVIPLSAGEKEKIKFPFCSKWCPNTTNIMNVNVADFITNSSNMGGMCVAIASIRHDILTNYPLPVNTSSAIRRSDIYWLNVISVDERRSESNYNVSSYSKPVGKAVIQFPVWPESNLKRLECWQFNDTSWNKTSCIKMKKVSNKNITSVKCQCPFPGFYSVFAVDDLKPDQVQVISDKDKSIPSTPAPRTSTPSAGTTNVTTGSTPVATTANVTTTRTVLTTVAPSNVSTTSDTNATIVSTNNANTSTVGNKTSSPGNGSTSNVTTMRNRTSTPSLSVNVVTTQSAVSTVPSNFQPYKYSATFRINESYIEKVGDMKEKFEEHIEDQLQRNLNMPQSVTVDAHKVKDKITLTLQIQENELEEAGPSISLLKDQLKNGTLLLTGFKGVQLNIPSQDIVLTQLGAGAKSAITVFVTIVFIFLVILIGSVLTALYLRNTREHRSIRITEDLRPNPPAPKYLRLHDSVSLHSSGPSTPQPAEMESSLAVLTKPQRRGYETMETFSHFPGNI